MKTFNQFILEAYTEKEAAAVAPGMSPEKRRAALEKNARRQAGKDTPVTQKKMLALPAGVQGGGMNKRPGSSLANPEKNNSAIVKSKSNKLANQDTKKVDVKVEVPKSNYKPQRPGTSRPGSDTTTKTEVPDKKKGPGATTKERGVETKQRQFDVTRQPTSVGSARRMKTASDIRAARRKSQGKSPEERKKAVFDARAKSGRKGVNALDLGKAKIDREKRKFRQAPLDYTKNAVGKPVMGAGRSVLNTAKSTVGSTGAQGGELQSGKGTKLDRG